MGIWKISEDVHTLLPLLPKSQQIEARKYISKIKSNQRKTEWLATRALLFELLNQEKTIENNAQGKPFLADHSYHITISHTKNYVAILLHKNRTVGIDVETISDRVSRVAGKFISADEFIDSSKKVVHQLLHWSAKETLFKIMEEDEIDFREHLHIQPFIPKESGIFEAFELKTEQQTRFQIHYEVLPDAVLTWVVGS